MDEVPSLCQSPSVPRTGTGPTRKPVAGQPPPATTWTRIRAHRTWPASSPSDRPHSLAPPPLSHTSSPTKQQDPGGIPTLGGQPDPGIVMVPHSGSDTVGRGLHRGQRRAKRPAQETAQRTAGRREQQSCRTSSSSRARLRRAPNDLGGIPPRCVPHRGRDGPPTTHGARPTPRTQKDPKRSGANVPGCLP
jgi:hypothetical protein